MLDDKNLLFLGGIFKKNDGEKQVLCLEVSKTPDFKLRRKHVESTHTTDIHWSRNGAGTVLAHQSLNFLQS